MSVENAEVGVAWFFLNRFYSKFVYTPTVNCTSHQ